jgi:hypothetical protein
MPLQDAPISNRARARLSSQARRESHERVHCKADHNDVVVRLNHVVQGIDCLVDDVRRKQAHSMGAHGHNAPASCLLYAAAYAVKALLLVLLNVLYSASCTRRALTQVTLVRHFEIIRAYALGDVLADTVLFHSQALEEQLKTPGCRTRAFGCICPGNVLRPPANAT